LYGGDEYQLCFTLPNKDDRQLYDWIAEGRLEATRIGEIITCKDSGPEVLLDGASINKLQKGFDHFDG
jgi:thiamine monophosphate kinase